MIIEQSENLKLQLMITVRSDRGEEYVVNAQAAAQAVVDLFSNLANEHRFGWRLAPAWYEDEINKLRAACVGDSK